VKLGPASAGWVWLVQVHLPGLIWARVVLDKDQIKLQFRECTVKVCVQRVGTIVK